MGCMGKIKELHELKIEIEAVFMEEVDDEHAILDRIADAIPEAVGLKMSIGGEMWEDPLEVEDECRN